MAGDLDEALLQKCEDLIALLREHEEHAKLQVLLQDVEEWRDRLVAKRD